MMRFIGQMLMFPMAVAITSMDVFLKTMRAFQSNIGEGIHALKSEVNKPAGFEKRCACDNGADAQGPLAENPVQMSNTTASNLITKEELTMDDCDLGGDDLKYVSYSILFTKRDFETTLQAEKQEVIDYPTDGGSFGALKIADFMEQLKSQGIPFPKSWGKKTPDKDYKVEPQTGDHVTLKSIPDRDRKFIRFEYTVRRQLPKQEADYDRQKVDILRDIRDGIEGVSHKLGPS